MDSVGHIKLALVKEGLPPTEEKRSLLRVGEDKRVHT